MTLEQEKPDGLSGARLLERACDVIDCIAAAPDGVSRAEVIERTALPRATVARILSVLVERGIVHRDLGRRRYLLGFALLDRMHVASPHADLVTAGNAELRYLRHMTGETAYLAVLEGDHVVSIGKDEGAHPVRSAARLGGRKPLHCTSQGKSILSVLPAETQVQLVDRMGFERLTEHTIVDAARFLAELQVVQRRGYAFDDEEIVTGVRCVGAPVVADDGRVAGAVSIAGPAWRLSRERLEMLGPELAASAQRIAAQLRREKLPASAGAFEEAVAGSPPALHGLAPRGCPTSGVLWHADALGPTLRMHARDTDREVLRADEPLRGLELVPHGALALSARGLCRIVRSDGSPAATLQLALPDDAATISAATARPDGSLWVALTTAVGGSVVAAVAPDGALRTFAQFANPIDDLLWRASGDALLVALGRTGAIYSLPADGGGRQVLARIPSGSGRPVALAEDVEAGIWVALADGWAVARLDEIGETAQLLPLPVPAPTGLAFAGADDGTLLVASARIGPRIESLAAAPFAGTLIRIDAPIRGVRPFAVTKLDCLTP